MKTLKDLRLQNKTVIVRFDYNVPVENGVIIDDTRIKKTLETINHLLSFNCKIVILSHFGRVKTVDDKKDNSLEIVAHRLSNLLNKKVLFLNNCYGYKVKNLIDSFPLGTIVLLENTRYMDVYNKLESNNDLKLARYWATLGDIFINDAFGASHREHASTAGVAKFMPSSIGLLIENELKGLKPLINLRDKPFTIFMGGAKVEDKLLIIKKLLPKCDYLLLGGGILNSFLKASGKGIYDSLATKEPVVINELKVLLATYPEKIIMTEDFVMGDNKILDIKIDKYKEYLNKSKLIFVNGTPGMFERDEFSKGTKDLFETLKLNEDAKVLLGGGDTNNALTKFNMLDEFTFVSSGGGATLEYIADGYLRALEWID